MNINEVPADKLIAAAAAKLKEVKEIKPPAWSVFVKTGVGRQRPPTQEDWWYIRTAAVLRKVGVEGIIGTERLRKEYGNRKNRGHKPEHKRKASGSVIRKALQQLEAAGLLEKKKTAGRKLSAKGLSFLSGVAKEIREKSK
jgi:small subunit ribosomal protein S19e